MKSKDILLRWIHEILMDIRFEANTDGDIKKIAFLSNMIRNIPLELSDSDEDNDISLQNLRMNLLENNKEVLDWLEQSIKNTKF
jgi:hypothetical protein